MVRVYVHNLKGYVGKAVVSVLAEEEHEIVGSLPDDKASDGSPGVAEFAPASDIDACNALILSADVVIFPGAEDGALEQTRAALRLLKRGGYEGSKQFVLVSSIMTWARTKISGESVDAGLSESTFTKRKAAKSFSELKTLETQTLALARENLQTMVVAPGIMYGGGEKPLHSLFRQAWLCDPPALPVIHSTRAGANVLPMVHVKDMARAVAASLASPPESSYIVAVDKARSTLREVVQCISSGLGTGKVSDLSREETQELMLSEPSVGALNMHCYFDADSTTMAGLGIDWVCEEGLVANSEAVIEEYKKARDLRPIRLAIGGPPACSLTSTVASALAKHYYVPLVTRESAIAAALYEKPMPEPAEPAEGEEEVEPEPEPELTEAEEAAAALREEVKEAGENISDNLMCRVVKAALSTVQCRNQGWVLQGFPSTWREATGVWAEGELDENDGEEVDPEAPLPEPDASGAFAPTGVVLLDATDEWLQDQAMEQESAPSEEEFSAQLQAYRAQNADDNERSPASFFEAVLHVDTVLHTVDGATDVDALVADTALAVEKGSKPFNYHPTPEEEAAALRAAEEERKLKAEADAAAAERKRQSELEERERRDAEQARRLKEIQQQEEELLEARSAPLRAYLMKHVIPTLTEGLIETCKVMPEDPVDYLAEFMFRASPAVETKSQSPQKKGRGRKK
eukprot:g5008.t1